MSSNKSSKSSSGIDNELHINNQQQNIDLIIAQNENLFRSNAAQMPLSRRNSKSDAISYAGISENRNEQREEIEVLIDNEIDEETDHLSDEFRSPMINQISRRTSRDNGTPLENRKNFSICSLLMNTNTKQIPQLNDIIYKPIVGRLSNYVETNSKISSPDMASKRITINIGGVRFETYYSTLRWLEESRLAQLSETNSDFDPITNEYFFDRDPNAFLAILNYYRTGKLHAPSDICGNLFYDELNYWGISEKKIQPCCWTKYSATRDCDEILRKVMDSIEDQDVEAEEESLSESECEDQVPTFSYHKTNIRRFSRSNHKNRFVKRIKRFYHRYRPSVWNFLDDRTSSLGASMFFWFSVFVLAASIISFVLATSPFFRIPFDVAMNKSLTRKERENLTVPHPTLHIIEFSCNLFFSCEFVLRFFSSPNKVKFLRNLYNIFEFLAILPTFLPAETHTNKNLWSARLHGYIEVFYVLRILRIFTLVPKYSGLRVLLLTLKNSLGELILYLLMLLMTIMIFASFVFYAEQIFEQDDNKFDSILICLWWAIVTLTTLGYGDIVPSTPFGYIVGSLCALSGLIFLALPIPVIVNNFATFYLHVKARQKLKEDPDMKSSPNKPIAQHIENNDIKYSSNNNSINKIEQFSDQNALLMWKECKRRTIRRAAIFDNRTHRKFPNSVLNITS